MQPLMNAGQEWHEIRSLVGKSGMGVYFGGGFLMNSMPFSMLPLRPSVQV